MRRFLAVAMVLVMAVSPILIGCSVQALPNEITIGALLSLTGSVSSLGESGEAALAVAEEDINN